MLPHRNTPLVEPYPDRVDACWPISTAVPLPRGVVHDLAQLQLCRDDNAVPAQFAARSRWSPLSSYQWIGLDFPATFKNGKPDNYVLRVHVKPPTIPSSGPDVASVSPKAIYLQTAAGRYQIDKTRFAGPVPDEPWVPPDPAARCGPYVLDAKGNEYEARLAAPTTIEVIENGPVKGTVAVTGVYESSAGERLCRYVTHITAFAHSATLKIAHRTIIDFDPDNMRIADLGWRFPTSQLAPARVGVDGEVIDASPRPLTGTFLHQDRHDRCWILDSDGGRITRRRVRARADGFVSISDSRGRAGSALTLVLRDVYQKFPKELGVAWSEVGLSSRFISGRGTDPWRSRRLRTSSTRVTTSSVGTMSTSSGTRIRGRRSISRCRMIMSTG